MKKLTPTSYVLLGLLSSRPWSAYELNNHMQESVLRAFWPRAESHVYSEPKKLEANGLVSSVQEKSGGRPRTVYTITDAGRMALNDWLRAPTESYFTMQYEAMLKFLYAHAGDLETLRNNVEEIALGAVLEAKAFAAVIGQYEQSTISDLSGVPYNGIAIDYLIDVMEARLKWAESTQSLLAVLPDTSSTSEQAQAVGQQSYQRVMERLNALIAKADALTTID